jgi:hypothetical protein
MSRTLAIRFDADQRRAIDEERRAWIAKKPREGMRVDALPPLGGPDPAGKMTAHWLEPEFVDHLRAAGIPFELI